MKQIKKRLLGAVMALVMVLLLVPMESLTVFATSWGIANAYLESSKSTNNGYVEFSSPSATAGTSITVTFRPNDGYHVATGWKIAETGGDNTEVTLSKTSDNPLTYTFTMPDASIQLYAPKGAGIDLPLFESDTVPHTHEAAEYTVFDVTNTKYVMVNPTDGTDFYYFWKSGTFYLDKDITLDKNLYIGAKTVICLNGHTLNLGEFCIRNDNNLTIEDCTGNGIITGGAGYKGNSTSLKSQGGAIVNNSGATLTVKDITISGNSAVNYGGAIMNRGTASLNHVTIQNNSAKMGGAIMMWSGTLNIIDTTITGNTTTSGANAIYNNGGTITLSGKCVIYDNKLATGANHNIYLPSGKSIKISGLTTDSKIGISMAAAGSFVLVDAAEADAAFFCSDSAKYDVIYSEGKLSLKAHDWAYSVNTAGDTLEAYCQNEGCSTGTSETSKVSITISAQDADKDKDESASASLSDTTAWVGAGLTVPTIKYVGTGNTEYPENETAPTAVGTYKATITAGGQTAFAEFAVIGWVEVTDQDEINAFLTKIAGSYGDKDEPEKYWLTISGNAANGFSFDRSGNDNSFYKLYKKGDEYYLLVADDTYAYGFTFVFDEGELSGCYEVTYSSDGVSDYHGYPYIHKHTFEYEASGATLTYKSICKSEPLCVYTENVEYSITISADEETTYSGNTVEAALSDSSEWAGAGLTVPTIKYVGSGSTEYPESETAPTDAGTYKATITAGEKTAEVTFVIIPADQTAPTDGEGYTLSYDKETLIAESGYEVSTTNGDKATALTNNKVIPGTTYYVRKAGDANNNPSAWTAISIPARPKAPSGLTCTLATDGAANGSIFGVSSVMEYKLSTDSDWKEVSGAEITKLKAGTYQVRVKATETSFASGIITVSIDSHAHQYNIYVWSRDAKTHWHAATCGHTGLKMDEAAHIYGTEGAARYTCTVCKMVDEAKKAEALAADEAAEEAAHKHSYISEVTKPATYTETGIKTYTCECGDSYTEVIARRKVTTTVKYNNSTKLGAEFSAASTTKKVTVTWGEVADADGYLIYANYCGKDYDFKLIKTVKDADISSYSFTRLNGEKLDANKHIKIYVVAYKTIDGKKVEFGKTITAHVVGSANKTYTNPADVTVSKSKVSIAVGKTSIIKATVSYEDASKKPLADSHAAELRYRSSNKKVATVDANGKITAVGKGTCTVYVYAKNGICAKVTVTVK